ncbi:MAG: tyrosine-type recombinase/integrase [Streptosporangiales bacterium]|nr:tyrosine-type recombinase/integrase [Streptosporangiales bacterium]
MAKRKGRRRFGWVRKLPSGRYQASYLGADGLRQNAPHTFASKDEAGDWLTLREADRVRGDAPPARRGAMPFGPYGREWVDERSGLRPRTADLYRWLLVKYLDSFESVHLVDIDPAAVRRWRAKLLRGGVSATMVAKAYRLFRAIMMTAAEDDELIVRNPCRIRGAGTETPTERPVLTVAQVYALADRMPARLRVLVLLATFGSLRFGEVTALRRRDVDLDERKVQVRRAFTEVRGQGLVAGPPKSRAGVRTVSLPAAVITDLRRHLAEHTKAGNDALVFTVPNGSPVRRGNFNKVVGWRDAVAAIGATGLHFHDLRHTGNTLAADAGVSTRNLMARMGHDNERAALIYQHATAKADRLIADVLDAQVRAERTNKTTKRGRKQSTRSNSDEDDEPDEGAAGVLVPTG